mmetsp:Transcript_15079/g.45181  ORF Transcript_15079/g.45181 Transcript_15079/m.45181 type:complete len:415 (-) Transcript_15079:397-1641(-)
MSAHASWVAARAREVRSAAADAYDAEFEVARVVAECVDDVAVAAEHNDALDLNEALADARLELEVVSSERDALRRRLLERDAADETRRQEASVVRGALLEDVARWRREKRRGEADRGRAERAEAAAKRVPALERQVASLRREADRERRRAGFVEAARREGGARSNNRRHRLAGLEDTLALKVFSFLEAPGVLATAQGDRAFFARVDGLFAMGSQVALSLRSHGPRKNGAEPTGLLSGATASSVAGKLSASEVKAIIALDQRAKASERARAAADAEADDLRRALEGAEGVKDFLAIKLKDAEEALAQALDAGSKRREQEASDQEVIGFLDGRARDLERELETERAARKTLESTLGRDRDAAVEQLAAAVDARRDADETRAARERDERKTRRLLVKEVKTLRSQLDQVHRAAARRV